MRFPPPDIRLAGHRTLMPLRGRSFVDCLDVKPLGLFKVVPHVLEHCGGCGSKSMTVPALSTDVVSGSMGEVKRQTALGHLVEIAAMATDQLRFRASEIGWPVEQLWIAGDLLGTGSMVEVGAVVVVIDVPPEQMPWLALNPAGEWAGEQLRLRKRPMHWCYRPLAWPAWNHEHRRLVRFWSADDGLDDAVIEALRTQRLDRVEVVEPSEGQLVEQLRIELPVSARHLREIVESYWDRDWRRRHKGFDETPEDHLWRAAAAIAQIQDALEEYGT